MDIVIGKKQPVHDESAGTTVMLKADRKVLRKDQRKNQQDRRQSVRDGIIVSLSFKNERRKPGARRKADYRSW